jgi:hypothetical protein
MLEKEPSNRDTIRPVQWGTLILVLGCRVCAVLEKKPDNFYISLRRRSYMQWGLLLSVLGCLVCAVLEKESSNFHTQLLMKRRLIEVVSG